MFTTPTVFVLGAGASWHYGYPTGEDLVRLVINKARVFSDYCDRIAKQPNLSITAHRPPLVEIVDCGGEGVREFQAQWHFVAEEAKSLADKLTQVNPPVIDYFLGQNPSLQSIGKVMIAWVLLDCGERFRRGRVNSNRSPEDRPKPNHLGVVPDVDDWCRFVLYQIVSGCRNSADLAQNDVTFVTFNYDLSLEEQLYTGLRHTELFTDADVQSFIERCRIHHVYGALRHHTEENEFDLDTSSSLHKNSGDINHHFATCNVINIADQAAEGMATIGPLEKTKDRTEVKESVAAIKRARVVYVLGYGFDENNSTLLNLERGFKGDKTAPKSLFFTNFRNTNRVNRRVFRLVRPDAAFDPAIVLGTKTIFCEKSERDVYGALSLDFDVSEGESD